MTGPRLTVGFMRMLLASGMACGVERSTLLDAAGLTESDLIDPDAAVPLGAQLAIGRAITEARPGVNVGLVALRYSGPGMLGVLGYALSHCPTLRDALGLFIRYQTLLTDVATWRLVGDRLYVGAHPSLVEFAHPIEHMMGLWVVLGRKLTGQAWVPREVCFRHAPMGDPAEHEAFFGVAPRFEAEADALHLPEGALDLPIQGARIALRPGLVALLEASLPEEAVGETYRAVMSALREHLSSGGGDRDTDRKSVV